MRDEAEHWWSEERHKVEIAEAYRKGWENAKEECAKVVENDCTLVYGERSIGAHIAAAIRALKDKP